MPVETGDGAELDAGTDFGNVGESCTPEELLADCAGMECGTSPTCVEACGACAEGLHCREGACVDTEDLCALNPSECECASLEFSIMTYAACSIGLADGASVDGEAFITLDGETHRVLAVDRYGDGHVIAWCDGSTGHEIERALNGFAYLSQSQEEPRVASFGRDSLCSWEAGVIPLPRYVEYLGAELPAKYLGDPARLAADYDVLMICGWYTMWDAGWAPLIQSFVSDHGKGLFAIMEYEGIEVQPMDYVEMTKITEPMGILFNPLLIPWAPADATVSIDCLPDYVPPPE